MQCGGGVHCVKAINSQLLNGSYTRVWIAYVYAPLLDREKFFREFRLKYVRLIGKVKKFYLYKYIQK